MQVLKPQSLCYTSSKKVLPSKSSVTFPNNPASWEPSTSVHKSFSTHFLQLCFLQMPDQHFCPVWLGAVCELSKTSNKMAKVSRMCNSEKQTECAQRIREAGEFCDQSDKSLGPLLRSLLSEPDILGYRYFFSHPNLAIFTYKIFPDILLPYFLLREPSLGFL